MKKKLELKKETVASLTTMNNLRGGTAPTPTLERCIGKDGPSVAEGCVWEETMGLTCGNPNQTKNCSIVCSITCAGCVTRMGATCEGGANNCIQTGNC